jgi:2-polyprenyl-3-methyl-5-hydroxy-6-metoxy-1,4-benzoquinol methylase
LAINDALISPGYRAQNCALLRAGVGFAAGGAKHGKTVLAFAEQIHALSVLDYGCGSGRLAKWLGKERPHLLIAEYDPAITKKSGRPKPRDLVVCTDVLEHVEPALIDNVLADLKRLAKKGAFLSIATRPSNKTLPDGRNAHLIVRQAAWWVEKVRDMGWPVREVADHDPRGVQMWLGRGRA